MGLQREENVINNVKNRVAAYEDSVRHHYEMIEMEKIEQLFRQHYSKMFLVSRMILGDEETARDVVSS